MTLTLEWLTLEELLQYEGSLYKEDSARPQRLAEWQDEMVKKFNTSIDTANLEGFKIFLINFQRIEHGLDILPETENGMDNLCIQELKKKTHFYNGLARLLSLNQNFAEFFDEELEPLFLKTYFQSFLPKDLIERVPSPKELKEIFPLSFSQHIKGRLFLSIYHTCLKEAQEGQRNEGNLAEEESVQLSDGPNDWSYLIQSEQFKYAYSALYQACLSNSFLATDIAGALLSILIKHDLVEEMNLKQGYVEILERIEKTYGLSGKILAEGYRRSIPILADSVLKLSPTSIINNTNTFWSSLQGFHSLKEDIIRAYLAKNGCNKEHWVYNLDFQRRLITVATTSNWEVFQWIYPPSP